MIKPLPPWSRNRPFEERVLRPEFEVVSRRELSFLGPGASQERQNDQCGEHHRHGDTRKCLLLASVPDEVAIRQRTRHRRSLRS